MTKDLAVLVYGDDVKGKYLNTQDFLAALKRNLDKKLN
jgi:isocitrate dehydrogenase